MNEQRFEAVVGECCNCIKPLALCVMRGDIEIDKVQFENLNFEKSKKWTDHNNI